MIIVDRCVSTLVGPGALGRDHWIVPFDDKNQYTEAALITLADQTNKVVVYIHLDAKAAVAQAYFYHGGREVQHCGSGNIAAAHYMFDHIPGCAVKGHALLETRQGTVDVNRYRASYGYVAKPRPLKCATATANLSQKLGLMPTPSAIYFAGNDNEYLIAFYPSAEHVKDLTPDFNKMKSATQRSVIVTAPSGDASYDYVFRYFAPQWGNPEDLATGSAVAVTTPLWHSHSRKYDFVIGQLSKTGALIQSQLQSSVKPAGALVSDDAQVHIFGACHIVTQSS